MKQVFSVAKMSMSCERLLCSFVVLIISCSPAFGGGPLFMDFDTQPELFTSGVAEWREFGGRDGGGYLKITDANNGEVGSILIGELEEGELVAGFNITADLRVGGGTERPADGFSFNFASFDDPGVLDIVTGGTGVWAPSPNGTEDSLPEEGTRTGIAIGFDEWDSGEPDVVGLSLRVDNELIDQAELPVLNDGDSPQSLQTGPMGVDDPEELGWAQLTINLDPISQELLVVWKDEIAFETEVPWTPRAGVLLFGGRTGGANAYHHIDNIFIETFPEIGPGITCDFDLNGTCNLADIDALIYEGIPGGDAATYDLDGNGSVGPGDVRRWHLDTETLPGDSNLDGIVNAADLNNVGGNWQSDSSTSISQGDFNGDGNTNAADLNTLGNNWQKTGAQWAAEQGAAPLASAVPEPASALMTLFALLGLMGLRRKS